MKVYDTNEHTADRAVPADAPGPATCDDIDIRHRKPLYADGDKVRNEYVIACNNNANDEWLSIQRRERAYLDGDRELVVDLEDWA